MTNKYKTAFDVTVVLVSDDYQPDLSKFMQLITSDELVYYGEDMPSNNGRPIVYMIEKRLAAPGEEE